MADKKLDRRSFLKLCASAGLVVAADPRRLAHAAGGLSRGARASIVDSTGNPVRCEQLEVGQTYVFHYPYVSTPCFLINLGRPAEPGDELRTGDGRSYRWQGGVGPGRSIVAFSAICAHKMSYPTRSVSFIDYRHEPVSGNSEGDNWWNRGQVIYCCSEGSVYDPRDGARVMAGPAPQPLAAVSLEFVEDDCALYATGVYGGAMLEQFLEKFGFQVALAHKTDDVWRPARESAIVWPLDEYSRTGVC